MFAESIPIVVGFPGGSVVKNLPANAGDTRDTSSIPGLGRSPGVGNGNPLQYSGLENSMNRGAWQITIQELDTTERENSHIRTPSILLYVVVGHFFPSVCSIESCDYKTIYLSFLMTFRLFRV